MSLANLFFSNVLFYFVFFSCIYFIFKRKQKNLKITSLIVVGVLIVSWFSFAFQGLFSSTEFSLRQLILLIITTITAISFIKLKTKIELTINTDKKNKIETFFFLFIYTSVPIFLISLPILSTNHMPGKFMLAPLDLLGIIIWMLGIYIHYQNNKLLEKFSNIPLQIKQRPDLIGFIMQFWSFYLIAINGVAGNLTFVGPLLVSIYLINKSHYPQNKD